jgi:galactokinase
MIDLLTSFERYFDKKPTVSFFCPGRVNLIGEHLDYNGGLVMPVAITLGTMLLTASNNLGTFRFRSLNFVEEIDLDDLTNYFVEKSLWYNYPIGILKRFSALGHDVRGLDLLYYGNIPIGAGISSSASIEVVTAFAVNHIFRCGCSKLALVKLAQFVENNFIGVNCGIMDQFAVTFGQKDAAMMLDCKTLTFSMVRFRLGEYMLVIINTNKPRKLAESKYNERVAECKLALSSLNTHLSIDNLCDLEPHHFLKYQNLIEDPIAKRRAQHVVEENDRVKKAGEAMANHEIEMFGKLMFDSHKSLKENYEVSGVELDTIVDYCKIDKNVIGARMTGAGFGGCAIALVKKKYLEKFTARLKSYYVLKIGYEPSVYHSKVNHGVHVCENFVELVN